MTPPLDDSGRGIQHSLILRLPGLRRFGEHIRKLVRRVAQLQQRVAVLEARLSEAKRNTAVASASAKEFRAAAVARLKELRRKVAAERRTREAIEQAYLRRVEQFRVRKARLLTEADALRASVLATRRRNPSGIVLGHQLRFRHQALIGQARHAHAVERERAFLAVSAAYARAVSCATPVPRADLVDEVEIHGLSFWVPKDRRKRGGLADRLLKQRKLPWGDILAARDIGVGAVMLDIGANVGTTSIPRVVAGDVQFVYAAEPDPENYACLVRNVRANGLAGFVMPEQCAISDVDGSAVLLHTTGMANHRLVPAGSSAAAALDAIATVEVPALTVDTWVARIGLDPEWVAFVKCDTQGWESRVLAGAAALLAHKHIAWILEFSPKHLNAAGTAPERLLSQIADHFTHFIDERGPADTARSRPVCELRDALSYLVDRREKNYTNLFLYSAG